MNFIGVALIGVIAVGSGLVLNMDRPFMKNQSQISQAAAADNLKVHPAAEFTQKELSKKRFRTLWNIFRSEPWRLSRPAGEYSPRTFPIPASNTARFLASITTRA